MTDNKKQYVKDLKTHILKLFLKHGAMCSNEAFSAISGTVFTSSTAVYYAIKALEKQELLVKQGGRRPNGAQKYVANVRLVPKELLIEVFGGAD